VKRRATGRMSRAQTGHVSRMIIRAIRSPLSRIRHRSGRAQRAPSSNRDAPVTDRPISELSLESQVQGAPECPGPGIRRATAGRHRNRARPSFGRSRSRSRPAPERQIRGPDAPKTPVTFAEKEPTHLGPILASDSVVTLYCSVRRTPGVHASKRLHIAWPGSTPRACVAALRAPAA
jgi:hypothetical protein